MFLFQIIFESKQDYPNQKDRPKSLHIQTSRATITNVRSVERSSRADLAQCLNAFQTGQMFFGTEFPNIEGDFNVVTEKFLEHSAGNHLSSCCDFFKLIFNQKSFQLTQHLTSNYFTV